MNSKRRISEHIARRRLYFLIGNKNRISLEGSCRKSTAVEGNANGIIGNAIWNFILHRWVSPGDIEWVYTPVSLRKRNSSTGVLGHEHLKALSAAFHSVDSMAGHSQTFPLAFFPRRQPSACELVPRDAEPVIRTRSQTWKDAQPFAHQGS